MAANIKKTSDEAIIANITKQNYHVALVLLGQLEQEQSRLSKENQIRYIECLIYTERYLDALEKMRGFIENGNIVRTFNFYRGYCLYCLHHYISAKEVFDQEIDWQRWSEKCTLMQDIEGNKNKPIIIGDIPVLPDPQTLHIEPYQNGKIVVFPLPIKGASSDQVKVIALPFSIDITVNNGIQTFQKSIELADEVLPKSLTVAINPSNVEIKLEKAHNANWPVFEKSQADLLGEADISFEKVLSALDGIPNYTDIEASEMFEQSQLLLMSDPRKGSKL